MSVGRRASARALVGLLALATALVGLVAPGALVSPAAAATGAVSGILSVDGAPASDVEIELLQWTGTQWSYGVEQDEDGISAADGRFTFSGLTPGDTYTFTVHGHFPDGTTTLPAGPGAAGTFVAVADTTVTLDLPLPAPGQTATGRVLTLDGSPAAGAFVTLGRHTGVDHPFPLFTVRTSADGTWALPLYDDQATYTVSARADTYLTTYLGDDTRYWEAVTFPFTQTGPQPDLTLQSQHVGGVVTRIDDSPAADVTVRLVRWNHDQQAWLTQATTTTGPTGRYLFRNTVGGALSAVVDDARGPVHAETGLAAPQNPSPGEFLAAPGFRLVGNSSVVDDLDVQLPPAPVGSVSVTGTRTVGATLTAATGSWRTGHQLAYRWLRDGQPIAGATGRTYRLTRADGLRRISVRVAAGTTYPGLNRTRVDSPAVTIRARAALALAVDPGAREARVAVRLTLPGTTAARTAGRVSVYVDGRLRATPSVRRGRAVVRIGSLRAGRHTFVVRYAGTSRYAPARAVAVARVR